MTVVCWDGQTLAFDRINDLLERWHRWESGKEPDCSGFPSTNASCKHWRASKQYDDTNGALDSDSEAKILEAVGYAIERVAQPGRTAVYFHARNLASDAAVWQSPRLPADSMERAALLLAAMNDLRVFLRQDGVI